MTLQVLHPVATASASHEADAARQFIYQFLALALSDPRSPRWQRLLHSQFQQAARSAADLLRLELPPAPTPLAPGELPPECLDLGSVLRFLRPLPRMQELYDATFGLVLSNKCPACETEFSRQTFVISRSQQMADIAGFYRAFGLDKSADARERIDHISLELEFMAFLIAKATLAASRDGDDAAINASICRDAQAEFFRDHLAWWVPAFALILRRRADGIERPDQLLETPATFFGAVAVCLAQFVALERCRLGIPAADDVAGPQQ
jgi:nitrate reductase assembly molybdenum cofactor insertion protein NarJ